MTTDHNPDAGSSLPPNNGYESESGTDITVQEPAPRRAKGGKMDELLVNFKSVFGHGAGKIGLSAAVIIVVVFAALAIRGLSSDSAIPVKTTQVDVPGAPTTEVSTDEISPKEADRRAKQAALEADAAAAKGQSYQPSFDPRIGAPPAQQAQGMGQPGQMPSQSSASNPPVPPQDGSQPVQVAMPSGQQAANPADEQRRQAAIEQRTAARDAYVDEVRKGVMKSVAELLGENNNSGIRNTGIYSTASYAPQARPSVQAGTNSIGAAQTSTAPVVAAGPASASAKTVIKAGSVAFAETDVEVNTDDGSDVFATMHGGQFDGAKLIGKVEQTPRNIKFRFNTLAPQDSRPTMSINAIAIREEDARQGMADTIDNHTIARFSALFSASILSGLGKAAAEPQGTIIVLPNGQTFTQQDELSGRRIAMHALGEVGTNAAGEMRKFVDQPPTYRTNAKSGIGIIFLTDVTAN